MSDAGTDDVVEAIVPTWRRDLVIEADIAEEITRVRGYDRVPATLPHTPMPAYRHDPLTLRDTVRETLVGAGLTEVVTHGPRLAEARRALPGTRRRPLEAEPGQHAAGRPITVTNPLSSQHSVLRQSLVGSLLEVVSTNLRDGREDVAIFEVGKGYGATGQPPTHEWWRLGFALTGSAHAPAWDRPTRPYDLDDAKGVVELVCRRLGVPAPVFSPIRDDPNLHPGRAARVTRRRLADGPARRAPSRDDRRLGPARRTDLRRGGRAGGPGRRTADRPTGERAVAPPPGRARPRGHRRRRPPGRRGRRRDPSARRAAAARSSGCSTSTAARRWPRTK